MGSSAPGSAGRGGSTAGEPVSCPSAPLLAGELRRAGLRAHQGKIVTVRHLVRGAERARLARDGALAADLESSVLLGGAAGVPRSCSGQYLTPRSGRCCARRPWPEVSRRCGPCGRPRPRWPGGRRPAGRRRLLLAEPRSFCAGVERAIEIVERSLERNDSPVYVRKQIVHNSHVVAGLQQRGAVFVDELSEVPDGSCVVFSAHGVSPQVRAEAARRGLDPIDATCPLVAKVHVEARRFAAEGYLVALIGHAGHEEVEGTLGEAPGAMVLIESADDVARAAAGRSGEGRLPDADHAVGTGGGQHRRRAARAVPRRPRPRQR